MKFLTDHPLPERAARRDWLRTITWTGLLVFGATVWGFAIYGFVTFLHAVL